jgi:hypothetical protein
MLHFERTAIGEPDQERLKWFAAKCLPNPRHIHDATLLLAG